MQSNVIQVIYEDMKNYTDIEQSRKLAEILPLESADMYWWFSGKRHYIEAMDDGDFNEEEEHVRAWSLAALLDVLPKYIGGSVLRMDMSENDFSLWFDDLSGIVDEILPDITKDNLVDACVEMIEKLHELKML